MRLMRHIDLTGMPSIYVFYCQGCQYVETVKRKKPTLDGGWPGGLVHVDKIPMDG